MKLFGKSVRQLKGMTMSTKIKVICRALSVLGFVLITACDKKSPEDKMRDAYNDFSDAIREKNKEYMKEHPEIYGSCASCHKSFAEEELREYVVTRRTGEYNYEPFEFCLCNDCRCCCVCGERRSELYFSNRNPAVLRFCDGDQNLGDSGKYGYDYDTGFFYCLENSGCVAGCTYGMIKGGKLEIPQEICRGSSDQKIMRALCGEVESDGVPVTSISDSAFYKNNGLKEVAFPSGLKKIGCNSFCNTELVEVSIPKSVEKIGGGAFAKCEQLRKVVVEEGSLLRNLNWNVFSGCTNLQEVIIPKSVELDVSGCDMDNFVDMVRKGRGMVENEDLGGVQLWKNGPYWAECNVGATCPWECGYYFGFGDTIGYKRKEVVEKKWGYENRKVSWISLKDGEEYSRFYARVDSPIECWVSSNRVYALSKLQDAGFIDSEFRLVAEYDAAAMSLGSPWRMPTRGDVASLYCYCDASWATLNGVHGILFKGRGDYASKSIFIPAAGNSRGRESYGLYWISEIYREESPYLEDREKLRVDMWRFYEDGFDGDRPLPYEYEELRMSYSACPVRPLRSFL